MPSNWKLAAGILALSLPAFAGEHLLLPGQSAAGSISVADEVDGVRFFARQGAHLSLVVAREKGGTLAPQVLSLVAPSTADVLADARVRTSRDGGHVSVSRLTLPETGNYLLRIAGADGTTGVYTLQASARPSGGLAEPLEGSIDHVAGEGEHVFSASAGSVVDVTVRHLRHSALHPRIARIEHVTDGAAIDLAATRRRTRRTSDAVLGLVLPSRGAYRVVCGGDGETTGGYALDVRAARKPALDFSVDPPDDLPDDPPPDPETFTVTSIDPAGLVSPSTGAAATVHGTGFVDGTSVALSPAAGTAATTTYVSSTTLTVSFDLAEELSVGTRSLVVTRPDSSALTLTNAVTITQAAPTLRITSISPSSGPASGGTRVLVTGRLFGTGAFARFGAIDATGCQRVDDRTLLCTVPRVATASRDRAIPVDVTVDDGAGATVTRTAGFTYDPDLNAPAYLRCNPPWAESTNRGTSVPGNLQEIVVVFDEPMNGTASLASGGLRLGNYSTYVTSWTLQGTDPTGRMLVLRPTQTSFLHDDQNYGFDTYVASDGSGPSDAAGNVLTVADGDYFYVSRITDSFGGYDGDSAGPVLADWTPNTSFAGQYADVESIVEVKFDEPVDPSTVAGRAQLFKVNADSSRGPEVPCAVGLDDDCMRIVMRPRTVLATSSRYSFVISSGLKDLSGNTRSSTYTRSFVTRLADDVAPVAALTVDSLVAALNGTNGYDLLVPRSGFTVDVAFSDAGGSGIDETSLVVACSRAAGSVSAGMNLASLFTVDQLGAHWRIDAAHALPAAEDVTFTASVKDRAGNVSASSTLRIDVEDITRQPNGTAGTAATNLDPFDARESWVLDLSRDAWGYQKSYFQNAWHPYLTAGADGTTDFDEDLELLGFRGSQSATGASSVQNGSETGTRAILRRKLMNAIRGRLNEHFAIAYDGARTADSVDIEFLLPGEQGSLAQVPSGAWTPASPYSVITLSGGSSYDSTKSAETDRAAAVAGPFDARNRQRDALVNDGATTNGVFGGRMAVAAIEARVGGSLFGRTFSSISWYLGGTPVGEHAADPVVLAGNFVYSTATAAQKTRFDAIELAVDRWARWVAAYAAKAIGDAVGTAEASNPPSGLYGYDYLPAGGDAPQSVPSSGTWTGQLLGWTNWPITFAAAQHPFSDVNATFSPLEVSYLRRRLLNR